MQRRDHMHDSFSTTAHAAELAVGSAAMAGELDGRVAAVTGATSGIGAATAAMLAGAGAKVALAGRREDRLTALAERIEGDGGRALPIRTDVGDEAQANAFVQRAHEELGGLNVLINHAGVMLLGPVTGAQPRES